MEHEEEVRELENMLAEATSTPKYYDVNYMDDAYIDPDSLWVPVVDKAGDGYPSKYPEGHWMNYANKEMKKQDFTSWTDLADIKKSMKRSNVKSRSSGMKGRPK